jgi:hypothetical protein
MRKFTVKEYVEVIATNGYHFGLNPGDVIVKENDKYRKNGTALIFSLGDMWVTEVSE